jgi:rubredoxin
MTPQNAAQYNAQLNPKNTEQATCRMCCPHCGHAERVKVRNHFLVGPVAADILSLVECTRCNTIYNADTGKPADGAIAFYFGLFLVLIATIAALYWLVQKQ